ncbi:MAG: P-loop NTPase family protein [Solirubrobacteraceae bacterium]
MNVISVAELFKAGPPLTEAEQIGRQLVIDALAARILAGEVVRLFDQRREGKTSLALAVLARAQADGVVTCHLPLDEYPTAPSAAARILGQLAHARDVARRGERAAGTVARLAGKLAGAVGEKELADLVNAFAGADPGALRLSDVLAGIRGHFGAGDRRAVIVIDEAHLIADWTKDDQAAVRGLLKDPSQRIGVLLASSEQSAEDVLIPILQFLGEPFLLPRVADDDWQHDLRERFDRVGAPIDDEALDKLLTLSTGQPYCTMLLARQSAEVGQAFGKVNVDVVDVALSTVRTHEAWSRLRYS